MTTRTRPYLIRDRDGDVLAVVRHCSGPAHAIRAYYQRLGLTAHVASADDAIAAVASGIAPFSAADPTAGLHADRETDESMATLAAHLRDLDPRPAPQPDNLNVARSGAGEKR